MIYYIKKRVAASIFLMVLISMLSLVSAEKLDVLPIKDTFTAGENIALKVSLLDSSNNPINTNVDIVIEDAEKIMSIEKTIQTNELVDINLGEKAPSGYWKITAQYAPQSKEPITSSVLFMVELNELAKFEIKDNTLTVINTGNARYTKTIQIAIGDTIGSKQLDLGVGERTSFRLIAPEGVYNVKVTDGKTTITQSDVALTGKVIGILDNRELSKSPLTTGVQGEEAPYGEENTPTLRNNNFVYVFLLVIFGAGILLAIEKRFRNKAQSDSKPIKAD